ncbi:cytochrome P450 [Paeniglutamicibacter psychrophenolicus]|uniref:cytochrome P450 n=1 Tax=Paeniglutamicibacter psychrophenolicus TaxID=257454 RepID=UPI002785A1C4|nr:cytochrome P450 [Paeniglutamicibacter psychrophenolicus]MDQ0094357.1 cytochrome P450 [Paeniglutamicibacter psychrophenolicus]
MSCPLAGSTAVAPTPAPLATALPGAYPEVVNNRYRSIEDPALVRRILQRPEDFTPANALDTAIDLEPAALRILAAERFFLPPVLASAGGAAHLAVRRIVARFFSPARVAAQAEPIRARVAGICSALATDYRNGARVDLAAHLAAVIPPEVMARLTGIPVPPAADLKAWSLDSLELFWGWPDAARQLELAASAAGFHAWLRTSVAQGLARDDGNLYAELHRGGVDLDRIRSLGYFLTIAGQETTAMLISTTLAAALHGGRWDSCAQESAAAQLVAQSLARASSVPTWRRVVRADIELDGERFAAGEQLVLRLSGGALMEGGDDDSLAFGFGIHRCLGAGLARMETEVVLHAAARALPGLEPAGGEPDWMHLLSFQSPRTVFSSRPGVGAAA